MNEDYMEEEESDSGSLEDEKLKCWSWSNLMPVTIKYNSSKKEIDMEQIKYIVDKIEKFNN